jgi:hypothetical protein
MRVSQDDFWIMFGKIRSDTAFKVFIQLFPGIGLVPPARYVGIFNYL